MTRTEHLEKAEELMELATRLHNEPGRNDAAGEMIWGATVHAMSAADPEHGTGEHRAPNTARRFGAAANRIATERLPVSDLLDCLANNQSGLHNHFYHGNLTEPTLRDQLTTGFSYLSRLIQAATASLYAHQ